MKIRKATKEDVGIIGILYKELFEESAASEPYHFKCSEQNINFVNNIINGMESEILLAEKNTGEIVGFALLKSNYTADFPCIVPHHYAYLMDLIVTKKERRKGIGALLLTSCKEWTKIHGLDFLELNVLEYNKNAIKMYEKNGFKPIIHTMQYR